jgi:hypothetical protein
LLIRHTLQPIFEASVYSSLFDQLIRLNLVENSTGDDPQASSSRVSSPASTSDDQGSSGLLSDVIIDVIWAVDYEIDSRKEFAASTSRASLLANEEGTDSTDGSSLENVVKAAKSTLVELVRELVVSFQLLSK